MDLVVFDLETTGLSPTGNEIIQIAAVRLRLGKVFHSESYSTFVNPRRPIPAFITSYTGISDAHVRGAPPICSALAEFSRFVGDCTILAHNGHRFDMPFIRAACAKNCIPTRKVQYADSIYLSRLIWRESRWHGLDAVLERLGISTVGIRRHDARGDVELLSEAVLRMWRRITPDCTALPVPLFTGTFPR
jgi:DNA polymerase III alpha subunit (gram-positive type)